MPEAPQSELKAASINALFPANLVEAQERGAALFTRANGLIVNTARAIWESPTELFKPEAEQAAKAFAPLTAGEDPGATVAAYCDQMHDGTDRMIAHMRHVNDPVRGYSWQLLGLYADSFGQAASKQFQLSAAPKTHLSPHDRRFPCTIAGSAAASATVTRT